MNTIDRFKAAEKPEDYTDALAIAQRWSDARVYAASGECTWDSRDYPIPSGGAW